MVCRTLQADKPATREVVPKKQLICAIRSSRSNTSGGSHIGRPMMYRELGIPRSYDVTVDHFRRTGMTCLLDEAVAAVTRLSDDRQDALARVLLQLAGYEQSSYILTSEEEADLDASIAAAERGEFATDDEMRAIWAKHGR
jgi:predicted transcriptional regulator